MRRRIMTRRIIRASGRVMSRRESMERTYTFETKELGLVRKHRQAPKTRNEARRSLGRSDIKGYKEAGDRGLIYRFYLRV